MPSKQLMGTWIALDVCLLAAGAISIAFSIIWRAPDLIRSLVISDKDLLGGTVLGVMMLLTWAISVGAIVQRNHITLGLKILNMALIADAFAVTAVGTFIWFFTLEERDNFKAIFYAQSADTQAKIQDTLKCCGYYNATLDPFLQSGFCTGTDMLVNATPCVTPITAQADYTLNNIFTSVYGFTAIIVALFITSLCIINMRLEEERFKRIDAKRGRAFV